MLVLPWIAHAQEDYSRTEVITYHDNPTKWVMGQVATVTCTATAPVSTSCDGDDVISKTEYDTNAMPSKTYAFGKLQKTLTYETTLAVATGQRGTLKTVSNGRDSDTFNTTVTLSSWKAGIPQQVQYPATTDHPVVYQKTGVNDHGEVAWVIDENGYKTCYTYDPMGRLASITYPDEVNAGQCDEDQSHWKKTTITFRNRDSNNQGYSAARGLPAWHWRQYIETGANRKVILFDAFWRPVVEQTYDNTSQTTINTTLSEVAKRYDTSGRLAFQSYPVRPLDSFTNPDLKGTHTFYDALDRVERVEQDTELGSRAITSTVYTRNRLKTEVTNPRGKTTYTWYQAYDQPHYSWPIQTYHPESAVTVIARDPFGKPTNIIRRNSTTSETATLEVARAFYYDINQLLCKVTEPETGTQIFKYDRADNLTRTALLPIVSPGLCTTPATQSEIESQSSPPIAAKNIDRTYDARNRLKTLSFSDGKGNQVWTYTPDSLPATVSAVNPNVANPSLTTYNYNRRRLLTREVLQPLGGAAAFAANYGYSLTGHLSQQSYPSGLVVDYAPNALGQPKQAGPFATGVKYHPNGAIAEFSYGNGIKHTLSQNDRGLPDTSCDYIATGICDANAFLNDGYDYDKNGNVAAISDGRTGHRGDRTMTYDGLDRLTKVVSPMFGSQGANYKYNALDNLERVYVGGTAARDHYFCYDDNWRLTFIRSGPVCTGDASSAVHALFYDERGNVMSKDNITYGFDLGNRLRTSPGYWYAYDGLGRRLLSCTSSACRYQMYSQAGQLLYTDDKRTNKRTDAIYMGGSLVALRELDAPTGVYTVKYQHTDALGSPVAVTSANRAILEKTENEPYGKVLNRPLRDGFGYTGHAEDAGTGLTYMQQRYYDPGIGRFLSVDPVTANSSTGANFNRYWYANNNPYKFTDPDGRVGIVTKRKDGSYHIAIPTRFSGPGALKSGVVDGIKADVANRLSGTYEVGGKEVKVDVEVTDVTSSTPKRAINNITLTDGPTSHKDGKSFVTGGIFTGMNAGEWDNTSRGWSLGQPAHEAMHLIGANDKYDLNRGLSFPGEEFNLMGQYRDPFGNQNRVSGGSMGEALSSRHNIYKEE